MFADSGNTLPRLRDGSVKVLAITSETRWPALPEVPTMGELGYPTILSAVWGSGSAEQPEYLRVFIGNLRKKLELDPRAPKYIKTEPWIGYRFDPE